MNTIATRVAFMIVSATFIGTIAIGADDFSDKVHSLAQQISAAAGFTVVAEIKGGGTEIQPPSTIVISREQVEALFKRATVRQSDDALSLIMAHETGHLAQIRAYGSAFSTKNVEVQRVFECQADMLAGKFLLETHPPSAETSGAILDALQLLYDAGAQDDIEFSNHPRPDERRECVRLGMAAGSMIAMTAAGVPGGESMAQKIEWFPGDTPLSWSMHQAKSVLHFPNGLIAHIELLNQYVHYDTNPSHPLVDYHFTYHNTSTDTISVSMDVQCVLVPRSNPADTTHTELISNAHYAISLPGNGTRTISGTLPWAQSNVYEPTLMPHLSVPPLPGSLITAWVTGS